MSNLAEVIAEQNRVRGHMDKFVIEVDGLINRYREENNVTDLDLIIRLAEHYLLKLDEEEPSEVRDILQELEDSSSTLENYIRDYNEDIRSEYDWAEGFDRWRNK